MENNPLVTIYITTFNRVDLLKRAVNSVMEQTYDNIEVIIVDDCSDDGTVEYLNRISSDKIRVILKEKKSGACVSRNLAINSARGVYITGLDDDDYFLHDRIERFMENAKLLEEYAILFSSNLVKEDEHKIVDYKKNVLLPNKVSWSDLIGCNLIGNQCFTRVDILKNAGGFDQRLPAWQDLDAWINVLSKNKNLLAKRIDNKTYIQDVSHDFERITSGKKERILEAFEYIAGKYSLNKEQQELLSLQLIGYGISIPKIEAFKYCFKQKNIYSLLISIKACINNALKREAL